MVGDALREPAGVDEDQRRSVGGDELGEAIVDLGPHLVGGHGSELVSRDLDGELHVAAVSDLDDIRRGAEEARDLLDRFHRGGKADSLRPLSSGLGHQTSSLSSESARWAPRLSSAMAWISSTITVSTLRRSSPALLGGEEDEERLRSRDQDVRRRAEHLLSSRRRACRRCGPRFGSARGIPRFSRRARGFPRGERRGSCGCRC